MKKLLFLIPVLLCLQATAQMRPLVNGHKFTVAANVVAQFNFTSTVQSIAGWVDVAGNPDAAIVTATDSRSGSAIGVSSVNSTDPAYWNLFGTNSGYVALTGTGHVLPTELYRSYFFQYSALYTPGKENIEISGLDNAKTYKFEILMSRQGAADTRRSKINCIDNAGTTFVETQAGDYNGTYNAVFTGKVPVSGVIKFAVEKGSTGDFGYLNCMKITQEN